ncbi:pyridoxamine 5'-phosphate oxidase family protein [Rubrivivax sp. RP6-9]|uniref:pyridoxamine 5'-phosphate oxidase family protein n=1 Tax=Rubrivivax sp. RP6-9 TaxID=3415750 RepID=UPI003CC6D813
MGTRLDDLAAIEGAVWQALEDAVRVKGAASAQWRVAVLATRDGDEADARSVVLREIDSATRTLLIYTDARSAKLAQIAAHPQGMLVLWSEALGWQLRLRVQLQAGTDGLALASRWARIQLTPAAHDYLSPLPPGSPLAAPRPERGSRAHFAVLTARVVSVDWLELHADGHRRARFDAGGRRWLTP